jgi:soluble lytic murein transglycosylase-like protein
VGALKCLLAGAVLVMAAPAAADPLEPWAGDVAQASLRFGIPEEWIWRVMRLESGARSIIGGQKAVSRAGAMGLMQLMPGTWRAMHALLGLGPDPFEPRDNIIAGTAYLRLMYDRFGYPGLFAAYNAGPVRYAAYLAGGRALPLETRTYLARASAGDRAVPSAADAAPPKLFALPHGAEPATAEAPGRLFALRPGAVR